MRCDEALNRASKARRAKTRADDAYARGHYRAAAAMYRDALRLDAFSEVAGLRAAVHCNVAACALVLDRSGEAVAASTHPCRDRPDYLRADAPRAGSRKSRPSGTRSATSTAPRGARSGARRRRTSPTRSANAAATAIETQKNERRKVARRRPRPPPPPPPPDDAPTRHRRRRRRAGRPSAAATAARSRPSSSGVARARRVPRRVGRDARPAASRPTPNSRCAQRQRVAGRDGGDGAHQRSARAGVLQRRGTGRFVGHEHRRPGGRGVGVMRGALGARGRCITDERAAARRTCSGRSPRATAAVEASSARRPGQRLRRACTEEHLDPPASVSTSDCKQRPSWRLPLPSIFSKVRFRADTRSLL